MRSLIIAFAFFTTLAVQAQHDVLVLSTSLFDGEQKSMLADTGSWVFKKGNDVRWSNPDFSTDDWDTLRPGQIRAELVDEQGKSSNLFSPRSLPDRARDWVYPYLMIS